MVENKVCIQPIISSIQKIALYETKSRFYLVGSNNTQTRFRVLKIDRTEPRELSVVDDGTEYSHDEIRDLVTMIDVGNRTRVGQRLTSNGVARVVSAFGIVGNKRMVQYEEATDEADLDSSPKLAAKSLSLWRSVWKQDSFPRLVPAFGLLGFVRFLEGYYIILVTKRRRVAVIGHHTLYKIEDTSMIYIPNDGVRTTHPDEQRYLKMFQSIDLSSNFYFSYSYDLSHTLQSNLTPPCEASSTILTEESTPKHDRPVKAAESHLPETGQPVNSPLLKLSVRNRPNRRFVWNNHLLSQIEQDVHPDWLLYVVHGFVGQSNVSVFGRSMYVTLLARRSSRYAGTRFLKRGANFQLLCG